MLTVTDSNGNIEIVSKYNTREYMREDLEAYTLLVCSLEYGTKVLEWFDSRTNKYFAISNGKIQDVWRCD